MDTHLSLAILGETSDATASPESPSIVRRVVHAAMLAAILTLTLAPAAHAAGGGAPMPWDGPLTALLDNLAGPTARVLVTLAVVASGLMWAFTRNEEGLKRLGQIAFGGAIALGAAALMASLGFAGAVV